MKRWIIIALNIALVAGIYLAYTYFQDDKLEFEEGEYFEGVITYKVEIDAQGDKTREEQVRNYTGEKVIYQFREGNVFSEDFNKEGESIGAFIISREKGKTHMEFQFTDTILWFDFTEDQFESTIEIKEDQEVMGYRCKQIAVTSYPKEEGLYPTMNTTYFISNQLPVDVKWFENYNYEAFNEVSKICAGMILKTITINDEGVLITRTAVKVEKKSIPRETFEIDPERPLKSFEEMLRENR